jgi:hypothetical protein
MTLLSLVASSVLLLAVAFLVLGMISYRRVVRFIQSAAAAEGTVIDLRLRHDSDGDPLYYPVFRFQDSAGKEYEICSDTGSNPPGFAKGAPVDVLYDPSDPESARLDSFVQLWFLTTLLFGFGGVATVASVALFLVAFLGA